MCCVRAFACICVYTVYSCVVKFASGHSMAHCELYQAAGLVRYSLTEKGRKYCKPLPLCHLPLNMQPSPGTLPPTAKKALGVEQCDPLPAKTMCPLLLQHSIYPYQCTRSPNHKIIELPKLGIHLGWRREFKWIWKQRLNAYDRRKG